MRPTRARSPKTRLHAALERLPRLFKLVQRALTSAIEHDSLNIAQAAAYSAMVSLFPALIVAAAVITWLPDTAALRRQAALFFDRILPPDVSPLLKAYFENGHHTPKSTEALIVAFIVSFVGASSVIVTLMEGFRRAFDLPTNEWSFWERRWRSFALVPITFVPLALASLLIVFGHLISDWVTTHLSAQHLAFQHPGTIAHAIVIFIATLLRWTIALAGSVGVIGAIYHMGVPASCLDGEPSGSATPDSAAPHPGANSDWNSVVRAVHGAVNNSVHNSVSTVRAMSTLERSWTRTLPGATLATALWFLTTLAFGLYVTRFANYSQVYGSLGAGIALLFWLYIISFSVLAGAEFNAQLYPDRRPK